MRTTSLALLILLSCSSCIDVLRVPLYGDRRIEDLSAKQRAERERKSRAYMETRSRIEHAGVRAVLFPVNFVADYIGNFVVNLPPGNLWPLQYMVLPFASGYYAARDATHGYPFWEPTARWN